ncbi:rhomboid family intramembrane serine protease [Longimycelium tulufanense]|uniref:Rhomboid family intramembrane serine protease n=1 Tax=Longimycelium tulufanense TaxID=907463 RepID=A0A8J3CJS5_9PSEU|nr:rhomboid family intramembrane serine protease [Longimycelium tulufanense]GGM78015.1 rhomboid family intramembrane serine protease [Longimycelium tulufanense]
MTVPPGPAQEPAGNHPPAAQPCPRHPDRTTALRCTRCDRPACPECLREAAVGYQCVDCVSDGRRTVRRPRTVAGAELRTKPIVVPVLIAVNLAIFVITAIQGGGFAVNYQAELFRQWAMYPVGVAAGDWWRMITSGFLHIGPFHVALNMFALWILGRDMEIILGRLRFSLVYVLSLLSGSTAVLLFGEPLGPVAGASGAVFGLLGGIAVAAFRLRLDLRPILMVLGINLVISFLPGISMLGHLGGLVAGAAVTAGMVYAPARNRAPFQVATVAGVAVVLAVLISVGILAYY